MRLWDQTACRSIGSPFTTVALLLPHRQVRPPAALKPLCRHYLVSKRSPQIQADIPPGVHVIGKGDGLVAPGRSLRPPDTPVLKESLSAINGRRVDSLGPIKVICTAIAVDGT